MTSEEEPFEEYSGSPEYWKRLHYWLRKMRGPDGKYRRLSDEEMDGLARELGLPPRAPRPRRDSDS